MNRLRLTLSTLIAVVHTLALVSCGGGQADPVTADPITVDITTADRESFPVVIDVMGAVVPRPEGSAELAAPGSSRVLSIAVGVGDAVRAGQRLLVLDPSVWDAQLADAEAAAGAARQADERARRLADQGILPRRDAEQAAAERARADAALVEARRTRSQADVRTPIAGVVDRIDAQLYQIVAEGEVLARVVDPNGVEILFRLSPDDAARVRAGMPVLIDIPAADTTPAMGQARILAVAASIDPASGAVPARAKFDSGGQSLRIGQAVHGLIEVERHEQAVVVPAEAIVDASGGKANVFTVGNDGLAHIREVRTGARAGGRVEILQGLDGGEKVVTRGAYALRDSVRVVTSGGARQ